MLEAVGRRDEAVGALSAGAHLASDLGDEGLAVRALVATAAAWRGLGDEGQAARLAQDALDQLVDRP